MSPANCEKEKYLSWVAQERDNGLVDVKFFIDDSARGGSEEEFYKEANEIVRLHNEGKAMDHEGLF